MPHNHILLAAGGTGGHVFPAIAVGLALKAKGWTVDFQTDLRGLPLLAAKSNQTSAFAIQRISAASPFSGSPIKRLMAMVKLVIGTAQATWHMIWRRPQVVVGFGGYASAPSLLAASILRVPSALHEQNGRIGRANHMLARLCGHLLSTWADSYPVPAKAKTRQTGLPVDGSLYKISPKVLKTDTDALRLHVQGGSLGAGIFSHIVPEALALLPAPMRARLKISQQTRREDLASVTDAYNALGISAEIAPFFDDVPRKLESANLIISRSGAASTAEIAASGRAAIFVPFAAALDDHQTANAEALTAVNGAIILPEKDANAPALASLLEQLLSQPDRLAKMGNAARTASHPDATNQIIAAITELAQSKSWRDA